MFSWLFVSCLNKATLEHRRIKNNKTNTKNSWLCVSWLIKRRLVTTQDFSLYIFTNFSLYFNETRFLQPAINEFCWKLDFLNLFLTNNSSLKLIANKIRQINFIHPYISIQLMNISHECDKSNKLYQYTFVIQVSS